MEVKQEVKVFISGNYIFAIFRIAHDDYMNVINIQNMKTVVNYNNKIPNCYTGTSIGDSIFLGCGDNLLEFDNLKNY